METFSVEEELENLFSIFPSEFCLDGNRASFLFEINDDAAISVVTHFFLPPEYPYMPCQVEIQTNYGLSTDQVEELFTRLNMVAQSCAGRPSLFDLISESREILHNFIFPQETEETEEIGQEQVQPEPDDEDVVTDVDSIVNIPHRSHALLQVDGSAAALRRLQRELRNFQRSDSSKTGIVVEVNGDNLFEWNVYFFNFEGPLANDMRRMGVSTIDLRVNFPSMYPNRPPFIRVLRPRFQFRTGHITIGGSICIEILTNQGWRSDVTIESILVLIKNNMGEGGGRLETRIRQDYSEQEAREAFNRMLRVHGWH